MTGRSRIYQNPETGNWEVRPECRAEVEQMLRCEAKRMARQLRRKELLLRLELFIVDVRISMLKLARRLGVV